tara:strand:+ start:310 stop:978 length:669 start_codon:yes stop_codon:yes gene_type:complete
MMLSYKGIYYPREVHQTSAIVRSLLSGRTWEQKIVNIFKDHVKPGDLCIDAGAFIGLHSVKLSDLVGPSGKVISFEPIPFVCECLRTTVAEGEYSNIQVVCKPLSDSIDKELSFVSDLDGRSAVDIYRRKSFKYRYDLRSTTLDYFLRNQNLEKLKLIKIDVEGSEWNVLKGGEGIIDKYRPILVIETWSTKSNLKKLHDFSEKYKYDIVTSTCENYLLYPL